MEPVEVKVPVARHVYLGPIAVGPAAQEEHLSIAQGDRRVVAAAGHLSGRAGGPEMTGQNIGKGRSWIRSAPAYRRHGCTNIGAGATVRRRGGGVVRRVGRRVGRGVGRRRVQPARIKQTMPRRAAPSLALDPDTAGEDISFPLDIAPSPVKNSSEKGGPLLISVC